MNHSARLRILAALAVILLFTFNAMAETSRLLQRTSPIPRTTNNVPHVQIGVTPDPAIFAELLLRVSKIHGVEIGETVISLPGAKGFWIKDDVKITRPDAIVRGREFAHIHPDGSLHASLPPELAQEAVNSGWAIFHPWAKQRAGWEGFVMIYTPGTLAEMEVVVRLIYGSYNFVTGNS